MELFHIEDRVRFRSGDLGIHWSGTIRDLELALEDPTAQVRSWVRDSYDHMEQHLQKLRNCSRRAAQGEPLRIIELRGLGDPDRLCVRLAWETGGALDGGWEDLKYFSPELLQRVPGGRSRVDVGSAMYLFWQEGVNGKGYELAVGSWREVQDPPPGWSIVTVANDYEPDCGASERGDLTPDRFGVYPNFPLVDGPGNPPELLREAAQWVQEHLEQDERVLVCCWSGRSRSVVVAALTMMNIRSKNRERNWRSLRQYIKRHHPDAEIHPALWELCQQA